MQQSQTEQGHYIRHGKAFALTITGFGEQGVNIGFKKLTAPEGINLFTDMGVFAGYFDIGVVFFKLGSVRKTHEKPVFLKGTL
jgi:hypothetical protein